MTLLSCSVLSIAQDLERIQVNGKIVVESGDIEGVTVFNASSNKGAITDFNGAFKIEVGINDRVEISALQFKKFTVIIDEGVIAEKKMTIFLVEQVNKLPEVVVSPYDLSGNIIVDIERVKTTNLPLDADDFSLKVAAIDLTPDYKSKAENPFVNGAEALKYNTNFVSIFNSFLKPLFDGKNKNEQHNSNQKAREQQEQRFNLRDMYSNYYMFKAFNIPEDKVNEFIAYVEDNGLDYNLLKEGREMEFIDVLVAQSTSFLAIQSDKD